MKPSVIKTRYFNNSDITYHGTSSLANSPRVKITTIPNRMNRGREP